MKLTLSILAAVLALGGCATSKTIIGQDGRPQHQISCDGQAQGGEACYAKAGELCGGAGYNVVRQTGESRPFFIAAGGTLSSGVSVTRTLTVSCRE